MNKKTKVIAIVNQKGGVGKTTTTGNLGYALANQGKDVLLIDFDSQASLSSYLNVDPNYSTHADYFCIYELLQKGLADPDYITDEVDEMTWEELFERCICRPTYKTRETKMVDGVRKGVDVDAEFGFDLLPSALELSDYDLYLSTHMGQYGGFKLKAIIDKILEWHEYDYVLIDCSPYLGALTINAIVAATAGVVIPTNLDLMSTWGVKALIEQIVNVQELVLKASKGREAHMGVIGIVLNLYRGDRTVDQTIQTDLERYYPFVIFKSTIPESVNAKKAVMGGLIYSQVYKKAENAYASLAKEVIAQIGQMEKDGPQIKRLGEELTTKLEDIMEEEDE